MHKTLDDIIKITVDELKKGISKSDEFRLVAIFDDETAYVYEDNYFLELCSILIFMGNTYIIGTERISSKSFNKKYENIFNDERRSVFVIKLNVWDVDIMYIATLIESLNGHTDDLPIDKKREFVNYYIVKYFMIDNDPSIDKDNVINELLMFKRREKIKLIYK